MCLRPLWKDVLAALWLGVLLPGIVLNAAVVLKDDIPQKTEQTEPLMNTGSIPEILLQKADGSREWLDINTYLTGVLLAEMPASFEPEALKAQAVAAGTYARKAAVTGGKHGDGSVCGDSACCQGFLADADYLSLGGSPESMDKVAEAVRSVSPYVLVHNGTLIEAVYFSCSGGTTEAAAEVWGADYPYLQSVDSPGEEEAVYHRDTVYFRSDEFQRMLGRTLPEDTDLWFGEVTHTQGNGVASIEIGGECYTGVQLRSLLGLRSTAFDIQAAGETIAVTTRGYGHRVGMSQYGADAMAREGDSYIRILNHYYPGAVIVPMD